MKQAKSDSVKFRELQSHLICGWECAEYSGNFCFIFVTFVASRFIEGLKNNWKFGSNKKFDSMPSGLFPTKPKSKNSQVTWWTIPLSVISSE